MKKSALFALLIAVNLVLGSACTKVETEAPSSPTVGRTTTTQTESQTIRAY